MNRQDTIKENFSKNGGIDEVSATRLNIERGWIIEFKNGQIMNNLTTEDMRAIGAWNI